MNSSKTAHLAQVWMSLQQAYGKNPFSFWVRAVVIGGIVGLLITQRTFWTPDVLLLIMLIIGLSFGRTKQFMMRFGPFLGLLIVYDSMRSWADKLNPYINFLPMIDFDRWLFHGTLPTAALQAVWWHGQVQWYDLYFYALYMLHFLVPVIIALILWRYRDRLFWPFVWSIVLLSFMAFVTFVAFPSAPPWMAKEQGLIQEPLTRISSNVWWEMGVKNFSEVYDRLSPNNVAAVPSLHSAYPFVGAVFLILAFGWRRAWWTVLYPISIWVGVVYLGEHYVFDVLAGIGYAVAAILTVLFFARRRVRRKQMPSTI